MALPVNPTPVYTLTIPSTKKEFKYRPFLVKEEKSLLIAQQSEDVNVMLNTIKEVIASCAKSPIDVDKLATFDIEYIFMQLRAISVGEVVDLVFACDTCTDEKARSLVQINIQNIDVLFDETHTNKIPLFGDVGVVMKYPTLDIVKKINNMKSNNIEDIISLATSCIDYIYTADEVLSAVDHTPEELAEFLNQLNHTQFAKIQHFFETLPALRHYIKYTCPVCNTEHNKYIEGLSSFF